MEYCFYQLKIWDKQKLEDGSSIPADELIEVIFLDENGHGKAVSDLPMGSYYVQEISTNSAYLVSDEKYPVDFEYAGQDTAVVHITANEGDAIENELIYGSVSGKKSNEDGEDLGASFRQTQLNIQRKMRLRLPHRKMTAVFLLRKFRMAHGLSVKSKA